uniref:Protein-serine/threonine phosphatase n=1 Tax=Noctiluca scintillans TaxID=2966 RepID=A0A7S1AJT9_NOCSC|mmetsp:Transcript_49280/g.130565  ORF Transcript_49280/g.130565 Transcript_49280/m.130565 type:complete len:667 (+) Transcript_49280:62-2062(+)
MGQSVSVDREPVELKELFNLGPAPLKPGPPPFESTRHHIKAWKFEKVGRTITDSPVVLCDENGFLNAEFQRSCSYLILHVHANGREDPPSNTVTALEDLAARASAVCTPRGLAIDVISRSEVFSPLHSGPEHWAMGAGPSTGTLRYAIFIWHGVAVDPHAKARVFPKAFELDRVLRLGLLWQQQLADSIERAVPLKGIPLDRARPKGAGEADAADRHLENRLCSYILDGRRPNGARYPRVGQSVCRSLGLAPDPPAYTSRSCAGPDREAMEVDCFDAELGRKRFRGCDPRRVAPTVPKTARTEAEELQQSRRGAMPVLNLSAIREQDTASVREAARSGQRDRERERERDGPGLNLEEINMSEEDLIKSWDPDNEENNYHLPHHLVKQLQLEHFRQVCSEVLPHQLYISSYQVAANSETLRKHGITHIVNTAGDVCENLFAGEFQYLTYYLKDINHEEISLLFYRTLEWMHGAIQKQGRVLVHCREGVSRSATMVLAYLMWRGMRFEEAHDTVRKARPICNPNTGFTCQLLKFGKKLQGHTPDFVVSRIAPHDRREPFLLLVPVDWSREAAGRTFDSRFGWVVQRGAHLVLWIGSRVANVEEVEAAARQHVLWLESFERLTCSLTVTHECMEPAHLWTMLDIAPPSERGAFSAPRPAFDADAAILSR